MTNLNKILIIGESGRGKSTFAEKVSNKLNIPFYSTDDFFWKVKFSVPNKKEESVFEISKIYSKEKWIVEGGTTHLISPGFEDSDLIINLVFKNIFSQWRSIIKRNKTRDHESFKDAVKLLLYVTKKRFGIGNSKEKKKKELLKPYKDKIITLSSYKEIDEFLDKMEVK